MQVDTKPYQIFKKLKTKFPAKMVLITEDDMSMVGVRAAFKDHREYVKHQFAKQGVEIIRFAHNYNSLESATPELGVVFLANDSVVNPGIEVWALIGHNAKYLAEAAGLKDGL